MPTPSSIVHRIAQFSTSELLFNQYRDVDIQSDVPEAAKIRRQNLTSYLEAYLRLKPTQIWILEAPSKGGALRTGVPLTSEKLLAERSARLDANPAFVRATKPEMMRLPPQSPTSRLVWQAIGTRQPPLLWNCVLLRPHNGSIKSTRSPVEASELVEHAAVLKDVIEMFDFKEFVWLGDSAVEMRAVAKVGGTKVRHPANDTRQEFPIQIAPFVAKL